MKWIPRTLIELPAGVATPPIRAAIGMPTMTALAKLDRPFSAPTRDTTPNPITMKTAQAGTSEMIVEVAAVPTMRAITTRRLSVPARSRSQ